MRSQGGDRGWAQIETRGAVGGGWAWPRQVLFLRPSFLASRIIWDEAGTGIWKCPLLSWRSWRKTNWSNSVSLLLKPEQQLVCVYQPPCVSFCLARGKISQLKTKITLGLDDVRFALALWFCGLFFFIMFQEDALVGRDTLNYCGRGVGWNCYGPTRSNNVPIKHSFYLLLKVGYKNSEFLEFLQWCSRNESD